MLDDKDRDPMASPADLLTAHDADAGVDADAAAPHSDDPRLQALNARLQDARAQPWKHGFTALLRALAATHDQLPDIGQAQRPQAEAFRLGQLASLVFAPREVGEVGWQQGRPAIRLLGLGMLGPNGPLPLHFTEIVRERSEAKRDPTLARFLDLFHHRALSHVYRAWAISQSAAGLDRPDDERFSRYIARLAGDEVDELSDIPLPRHARWASSAHRVRQSRDPAGLAATLAHYFGVHVELREFQRHWIAIDAPDTCRLGTPRDSSRLGAGALAGEVVPDCQHKFSLRIGPLSLRQYLRFTPQGHASGSDLRTLVEWVRAFVGYEYIWEVELLIARDEAPASRMGGDERLGWSSWMGQADTEAISGMVFQPENYLQSNQP
jgi:type VI secretion system protein ImpH